MLLGIAIGRGIQQATPAQRLAMQEQAAGARQDLAALESLAWANFDAGQLRRAEDLVTQQLQLAAKMQPMLQLQPSAKTLWGLIRRQSGATAEATALLQQSLDLQPGIMPLASRPAVRLADALWKKGQRVGPAPSFLHGMDPAPGIR